MTFINKSYTCGYSASHTCGYSAHDHVSNNTCVLKVDTMNDPDKHHHRCLYNVKIWIPYIYVRIPIHPRGECLITRTEVIINHNVNFLLKKGEGVISKSTSTFYYKMRKYEVNSHLRILWLVRSRLKGPVSGHVGPEEEWVPMNLEIIFVFQFVQGLLHLPLPNPAPRSHKVTDHIYFHLLFTSHHWLIITLGTTTRIEIQMYMYTISSCCL